MDDVRRSCIILRLLLLCDRGDLNLMLTSWLYFLSLCRTLVNDRMKGLFVWAPLVHTPTLSLNITCKHGEVTFTCLVVK